MERYSWKSVAITCIYGLKSVTLLLHEQKFLVDMKRNITQQLQV